MSLWHFQMLLVETSIEIVDNALVVVLLGPRPDGLAISVPEIGVQKQIGEALRCRQWV